MKTKMNTLLLLATISVLSFNCERNDDSSSIATKKLVLNDTIELKKSVIYEHDDINLQLVFDGIKEDSRCPTGVNCIWPGNAKAALSIKVNNEASDIELNTHPDFQQTVRISGYDVSLVDISPYPKSDTIIDPGEYTIEIFMAEADSDGWHTGRVIDKSGLDGCGLVIQTNNGLFLQPASIVPDIQPEAGQVIQFKYEELDMAGICMIGPIVKITQIKQHAYSCEQELIDIREEDLSAYPTDPIHINYAKPTSENCLSIGYGHSGGCQEHVIHLLLTEISQDTARLFLSHEDNGDMCEAYIQDTIGFAVETLIEQQVPSVEITTPDGKTTVVDLYYHAL
ncbi:MAG: hypothetical protein GVY19_13535 [Bacteroidetes bacterium]|nr:hypothetical protein [Bacteroidota bacterium]